MDYSNIENQIKVIITDAQSKIEILAEEVRTEVVLPFCKKYKLTYLTGNGMTCFYDKNDEPIEIYDWAVMSKKRFKADFEKVEAIINLTTIGYTDCLGFYIRDITKGDLKNFGER